ncbi:MAG: hypothetical protein J6Q72_07970 [Clostridia bacterium]|nr:hypothetical protein [Clostridia bacterium]
MKDLVKNKGTIGSLFLIVGGALVFSSLHYCLTHDHFRISLFFFLVSYLVFVIAMFKSIVTKDNGEIFLAALFQFICWFILDEVTKILLGHNKNPEKVLNIRLNNTDLWEYAIIFLAFIAIIGAFFFSKRISIQPESQKTTKGMMLATFGVIIAHGIIAVGQSYTSTENDNLFFFVVFAISIIAFFFIQSISIAHIRYLKNPKTQIKQKIEML